MLAGDNFMRDAEQLYKYYGSVEASFALLAALCLPRFAALAARIAAVLAEKAGLPNFAASGAWANPTHVVPQPSFSNLFEGAVKWESWKKGGDAEWRVAG